MIEARQTDDREGLGHGHPGREHDGTCEHGLVRPVLAQRIAAFGFREGIVSDSDGARQALRDSRQPEPAPCLTSISISLMGSEPGGLSGS
jgi:hypothetical protein